VYVPSERSAIRLQDILDNIRLIQSYLVGMDRAAFDSDSRTRDAVERCLERVSEAASKLGEAADELAPGPPWKAVRAKRHFNGSAIRWSSSLGAEKRCQAAQRSGGQGRDFCLSLRDLPGLSPAWRGHLVAATGVDLTGSDTGQPRKPGWLQSASAKPLPDGFGWLVAEAPA
jgi:hypothetical protein